MIIWAQGSLERKWGKMASDSSGAKLAVCPLHDLYNPSSNKYIYTSSDYGLNWVERSASGNRIDWRSITSNSDGTKLAAVGDNQIITSADSGSTWTTRAWTADWRPIASDSTGAKLIAATASDGMGGGYIYTSTDSGANWTQRTGTGARAWQSVSSSSDGTKLIGCGGGSIYLSTDSGETWNQIGSGISSATVCAMSSDGTKLAALEGVNNGYIYTSSNSGSSWTQRLQAASELAWHTIAMSSDGTQLIAAQYAGSIYVSNNSGETWSQQSTPGARNWESVVSNATGANLAASVNAYPSTSDAFIWTGSSDSTAPTPGNGGSLSTSAVTSTSVTLTWTKATDAITSQSSLEYLVYYSTNSNMDTVNDIKNGTVVGSYTADIATKQITDLTSGTNYYFNVLVRDAANNEAAYTKLMVSLDISNPVPGGGGTITIPPASTTANSVTLSWTKASDDLTSQAQLQYLVYYSTNSAMDTLEEVKANGTPFGSYEADIATKEVTGLLPGTDYYFNVVVKDNSGLLLAGPGNEVVYGKQHYLTPTLDVEIASTVPDTGTTALAIVPFTVTFIEGGYPVDDSTFIESDITVTNGDVEVSSLTGTGTSWSFNVVPDVMETPTTVQILAAKVQDTNNNDNTVSNLWTFTQTSGIDITRLGRFVAGMPRDVDIETNTPHVDSIKIGQVDPVELTKAMTELLATTYTTGLPAANVSNEAKQSILEYKLVALHAPVLSFTPTTGNTSDTVTTQVLAAADVDLPVGTGGDIADVTAWGIFVGTVTNAADLGKVLIRVSGSDNGVEDGTGDEIYGVLSESGGAYTLSYKTASGAAYTIQASDTSAKFDFYFVEVTDLYAFGVDRLLTSTVGGTIDNTTIAAAEEEVTARMEADSTLQVNIDAEITARMGADAVETTARTAADITLQSLIDAETTARMNADSTLQANLDVESTAREEADSTLQANIDAEITARIAGDSPIQPLIDAETTARADADSTLQANLDAEATARVNADSTLQANLDAEATARENADSTLQANLDLETTARLDADSTLQANLDVETTAREEADSTLQANLDLETTARLDADSTLQANLDAEVTARTDADSTLQANLDVETTARIAADSTVQANLDDEITARADADSTVQANVDAEATAREAADSTLQANIDAEATARADADSTVQANIDAEATARADADSTVQANLDVETTARSAADSTVQANLNVEITARLAADSTVQANLDVEITARADADSTLQANLDAEITARINADSISVNTEVTARLNADSTLQANLDSETTSRSDSDATLQGNIDTETTARLNSDSTIQANLNTEITARLNSDSTFQANLNTETTARLNSDSTLQSNLDTETTARLNADSTLQSLIDNFSAPVVDVTFTAEENITTGDVLIESITVAGQVLRANATVLASCESVIGVALETITSGNPIQVRTYGEATVTTDGTNFDIGKRVFVATTAGQASKTIPGAEGNVIYLLGNATNTNKVFVNPNMEFVVEIPPLGEMIPEGEERVAPAGGELIGPAT